VRSLALATALLLGCACVAAADEGDIETDRPDVSTSARTVARGVFQIETGVAYGVTSRGGAPAQRRLSWEATTRVGLSERVEVRADFEPVVRLRGADDVTGSGDYTFALKYRFYDPPEGSWLPKLGVLPFVKPPIAESPIGTEKTDLGAIALASFDLPAGLSLDLNAGVAGLGQTSGGYLAQAQATASLGWQVVGPLAAFAEVFYASRAERRGRAAVGTDGGLFLKISRDVVLDASIGTSLMGVLSDYVVRAGVSVRFGR
jgi:hypothetical protein